MPAEFKETVRSGQKCFLCQDAGRDQEAHRRDSRGYVCQWHFRGEPHPAEAAARRDEKKAKGGDMRTQLDEAKVEVMQRDRAAGLSVKEIAAKHRVSVSSAHKYTRSTRKARKNSRPSREGRAAAADGKILIEVAAEQLDAIWATLPLERKAALINRLSEV